MYSKVTSSSPNKLYSSQYKSDPPLADFLKKCDLIFWLISVAQIT